MALTPKHIVQAARQDLETALINAAVRSDKKAFKAQGASSRHAGKLRMTSFLPAHLRGAKSPRDVIQNAINDHMAGRKSKHPSQQMIYDDIFKLEQALRLASEETVSE